MTGCLRWLNDNDITREKSWCQLGSKQHSRKVPGNDRSYYANRCESLNNRTLFVLLDNCLFLDGDVDHSANPLNSECDLACRWTQLGRNRSVPAS